MSNSRQDAWSRDEDIILAETVLRYIREGKTQLEAFKDVANQLSRTSAACGFRWNATIRRHYEEAIQQAKQDRKTGITDQIHNPNLQSHASSQHDPIDSAIRLLENMKKQQPAEFDGLMDEKYDVVMTLKEENETLKRRLKRYEAAWTEMGKLWEWVTEKRVR
ncbi:uncharacterized protein JNUCC1_00034 [Lentibacillus sp. JNUCC-1]|uniref:RsfA family transcriptional regulator n=1 Tax=Lentibacillus sp. JNUCC-1 TaxID=2654513 RepID=UPI0012E766E5|nr:RsfA family transcriptional regulator [Lentibacillus sp. JNUCC-1]MUV36233.1 uncharacterized protein [Lentibacillus sp. JNUCC-1]